MKILAVPNSFKGSRSSAELCEDLKRGFLSVDANADFVGIPVADGGDGFLASMVSALKGQYIEIDTFDPLGRPIKSLAGIYKDTGIVEMALASGIALLDSAEANPLIASTYGTGLIIKELLRLGIRSIVIGIGGSATNDAGIGCLNALGYRFLDQHGVELYPSGAALNSICSIDAANVLPGLKLSNITVVCDVTNPLYGTSGASYVYAPQKGATPDMVVQLDKGLRNFAQVVYAHTGEDYSALSGAGAAGGIGFGLVSLAGASLKSGVDTVLELTGYEKELENADLVITGEGRIDEQTKQGKLPMGVGVRALKKGIPCIAICGSASVKAEDLADIGITAVYALVDLGKPVEYCIKNAGPLTEELARIIYRDFAASK